MQSLRAQIDKIDEEIVQLLGNRLEISRLIGKYKKEHNITIFQLERWKEILSSRTNWAKERGITEDFIEMFLEQLHKESIRHQTNQMNNDDSRIG